MTAYVAPPVAALVQRCAEDSQCWNWCTMGNHARGVRTVHGRMVVVDGAQLRVLVRNGHVVLRGQRMRGDASALRGHQCVSTMVA